MTRTVRGLVALAALSLTPATTACGGCRVDHSELISMEPPVECLQVRGAASGSSQCVTAALEITNGCSAVLTFARGWTNNGGKLSFAPGASGHWDADASMKAADGRWEATATLGEQTIKFTIKTYEPDDWWE